VEVQVQVVELVVLLQQRVLVVQQIAVVHLITILAVYLYVKVNVPLVAVLAKEQKTVISVPLLRHQINLLIAVV
jgi:hypothetical protein